MVKPSLRTKSIGSKSTEQSHPPPFSQVASELRVERQFTQSRPSLHAVGLMWRLRILLPRKQDYYVPRRAASGIGDPLNHAPCSRAPVWGELNRHREACYSS
jgi:hypothetical protein